MNKKNPLIFCVRNILRPLPTAIICAFSFLLFTPAVLAEPTAGALEKEAFELLRDKEDPAIKLKELVKNKDFNPNAVDQYGRSLLDAATFKEHIESLEILLTRGADINAKETDREGNTLLMKANSPKVAEFLLKNGADIRARNNRGEDVLTVSLKWQNYDMADFFISKGFDINDLDRSSRTFLMRAIINGNNKTICYLLSRNANLNLQDKDGNTAEMWAKKEGNQQIVKLLSGEVTVEEQEAIDNLIESISKQDIQNPEEELGKWLKAKKLDPNARGQYRRSLLSMMAMLNSKSCLKFLLENGADINDGGRSGSPLQFSKSVEIAKYLIDKGANVNTRDRWGNIPLVYVSNKEIAALLVEHGADIHTANKDGENAFAAILNNSGSISIAEILLSKGVNINGQDNEGKTALINAVERKNINTIKFLISNGANPNLADNEGNTAMDLARKEGSSEIINILKEDPANLKKMDNPANVQEVFDFLNGPVRSARTFKELLKEKGLTVNARSEGGITLLMWTILKKQPNCAKYLIQQKAYINAQDNSGKTALMHATATANKDMVALLLAKGADPNIRCRYGSSALNFIRSDSKRLNDQITTMIEKAQKKTSSSPK